MTTLTERVAHLETEVQALRKQLEARPNTHDYSGTTAALAERAGTPRGRRFGFGLPEVTAREAAA